MSTKRIAVVLCCILLSTGIAGADITGRQVMKKQERLHKVKTEVAAEKMILVDKNGDQEKRTMKRYAKDMGNGLNRALIVFSEPADIKGTALLTWEQKTRDNDQWLYLPATRKMQRVAEGSKKSYFMGTDFTFEDMEPEDIDNNDYKILRTETIRSYKCWVIEAAPANRQKQRTSSYSRRVLWVTQKHYYTVKIDFYDRREKLIKTLDNYDLLNLRGTVWRAKKAIMVNHKRNHKTLLGTASREIDKSLSNSTFTERYILSGRHLR